jgi:hypothetical protein
MPVNKSLLPAPVAIMACDGRSATRIAFPVDAAGKVSGAVLDPGHWEQRGSASRTIDHKVAQAA